VGDKDRFNRHREAAPVPLVAEVIGADLRAVLENGSAVGCIDWDSAAAADERMAALLRGFGARMVEAQVPDGLDAVSGTEVG